MGNTNYDIFISYRQRYIVWVESLYIKLIEQGYRVFLDNHSLPQGRPLEDLLYRHIDGVKHFIVVATNDIDIKDSWVLKECRYAENLQQQGKNISLHTLVFDPVAPNPFSETHLHIDFSSQEEGVYRFNFLQLCESFKDRKSSPFAKFEGWLDIPLQNIYALKNNNQKHSFALIREKALLAKCFSSFRSVDDVDDLNVDVALDIHNELSFLYKSKNKNIRRQALLLLCLLHKGHYEFMRAYHVDNGLSFEKISKLIKNIKNIPNLDKDRLQDIGCNFKVKVRCKVCK